MVAGQRLFDEAGHAALDRLRRQPDMRRVGGEDEEQVGPDRIEHGAGVAEGRRAGEGRGLSPAASAPGSATPAIVTGSPMVCSRRIAGIHFARATPPQPASASRSGRLPARAGSGAMP